MSVDSVKVVMQAILVCGVWEPSCTEVSLPSPSLSFCSKFMRTECLNSKFLYEEPLPMSRLLAAVGSSIDPVFMS